MTTKPVLKSHSCAASAIIRSCLTPLAAGPAAITPSPIMEGRCCDDCDHGVVIPMRILRLIRSRVGPKET